MHLAAARLLRILAVIFGAALLMTLVGALPAHAHADESAVHVDAEDDSGQDVQADEQEIQDLIEPQATREPLLPSTQGEAALATQPKAQERADHQKAAQEKATEPVKGRWQKTSAGWKYVTGSSCAHGFVKDGGKTYYLDPKTGIMRTGWVKVGDEWFCFNGSGAMRTGWMKSGGRWYYLNPSDGKMLVGKHRIGNAIYFLVSSGAMKTGWNKEGSDWYWYDASGAMRTGWLRNGGRWYYLNPGDGKMRTGRYKVGNAWYASDSSGSMHASRWVLQPEGWYYATGSGALKSGWHRSGGKWYWLQPDKEGLMIADARKSVSGALYSFDSSGAMRANCQIRLENGACGYASSSGAIATIGTFDGGKVILKDAKGNALTGWQKLAGKWFYGDEGGVMRVNSWLKDGSKWYWLAGDGVMATNAWVDNKRYYVGSDGNWHRYVNASASSKLVAAANRVGYQGNGYCAKWVDCVYMGAGYAHFDGHARDFYWRFCNISDLSQIEPGMVIAVPSHTRSSMGHAYGHVGIYMGNGMVRHNTGRLETVPLSSWVSYYQTTYPVKCGWAF